MGSHALSCSSLPPNNARRFHPAEFLSQESPAESKSVYFPSDRPLAVVRIERLAGELKGSGRLTGNPEVNPKMKFCPDRRLHSRKAGLQISTRRTTVCWFSLKWREGALRRSEYSALRAGIFKESDSTDPIWPLEEHRGDAAAPRSSSRSAHQTIPQQGCVPAVPLPFRPANSLQRRRDRCTSCSAKLNSTSPTHD